MIVRLLMMIINVYMVWYKKQYCDERVITKIERDDNVTPNKIIWNSSNSFVW